MATVPSTPTKRFSRNSKQYSSLTVNEADIRSSPIQASSSPIQAFSSNRQSMLGDMSIPKIQKVNYSLTKEGQDIQKLQHILEMKRKQTEDAIIKDL